MLDIQRLQTNILTACQELDSIRAVLLIGSRARTEPPPDDLADIDLLLFTTDTADFIPLPSFVAEAGELWLSDFSYTGGGDPEWMVVYEGGYKVDYMFTIIQPDETFQQNLDNSYYRIIFPRGYQVLIDKTASDGQIVLTLEDLKQPMLPTAAEFVALNDTFLLEASRTVKFIERRDMWRAKDGVDSVLKKRLLTMLEWHARAKYGLERDTWYYGRYLAEWTDPEVVAQLPETFGTYDPVDLGRALQATLSLYNQLAAETAVRLDFDYPTPGQKAALDWLRTF
jgi:aminoglycoside 6-adenylyltransferase